MSTELSKQDKDRVTKAVEAGRKAIKEGKTKIDAAMVIFRSINDLEQEIVVKAFVDGASLTPKGALTYWYNCRRKLKKENASK